MARFEMENADMAAIGGGATADILFEMGLVAATGRDCEINLVEAHKWLNIAAIKGSPRAAQLRSEISEYMSKPEIASALRSAREWMTTH
ncbi:MULTISPECIES: sel1 repeat family protein [Ahrensia]|uniref:sel1 repeat family protein n=1 Tax=Ahrensia TaxID=152180 RepID=UPI000380C11A|nr:MULTISPECIES: sel1 repeat family protein [Ahrensia]